MNRRFKNIPSFKIQNLKFKISSFFHPLVFYPLAGLAVFAPCLFFGQAYFDGDLLAQYVPMRLFLKSCILQGHFPLWCPYLLGGQPFFADPNTMSAYPLTYLLLPLPVPYGFGVFYFIHFLLAATGMYAWAKALDLSHESGLLAGLLLAFSGFFWWEIIHPPLLAAFAWMPWWGAALEKTSRKLEPAWAFVAGLVFALLFLSGNYQMTLGALYGGGLYLAFRLLTRREWRREPQKDKRLLSSPLFFIWGALPLLVLWIPSREFLNLSERLHGASPDYAAFQADLSLDPRNLLHFIFPLRPFDAATGQARPVADYLANAGYLGPWALFLFGLGLQRRKGIQVFLAAMGGVAVLTAFGKYFPLHRLLCFLAPGFGLMRAPFRYLFLYALAGSLLAAFGLEALKTPATGQKEKSAKAWWGKAAVVYALLVLACGWWGKGSFVPQAGSLILGGICIYFWSIRKKQQEWFFQAFLAVLLAALLPTAWSCASSRWGSPSNFDYWGRSRELQWLAGNSQGGRALVGDNLPYPVEAGGKTVSSELPPDSVYAARTRIAFGYNPLSLDRTTDLYTLPPKTFLRLMAVKCYATGSDKWKIKDFSTERQGGIAYGRNLEEAPFVYSPEKTVVLGDDQQLEAMRDPDFVPYRLSYLSERTSSTPQERVSKLQLKYDLVRDDPDDQLFRVDLNRSGWVVFSEMMYPGWKAWVDGSPSTLVTANHAFRSVWVGQGSHEVVFRYEPDWCTPILVGACFWALSVLALLAGPRRRKFWAGFQP